MEAGMGGGGWHGRWIYEAVSRASYPSLLINISSITVINCTLVVLI